MPYSVGHYTVQCTPDFLDECEKNNFELTYSPGECTELCQVIDDGIGAHVKKSICKSFDDDFESSEDSMERWSSGNVPTFERRNKMTTWLGDAWDSLSPETIRKCFKHCGCCNDITGKENHLVRIQQLRSYKAPEFGTEKMLKLTDAEIKEWSERELKLRQDEKVKRKKELDRRRQARREQRLRAQK